MSSRRRRPILWLLAVVVLVALGMRWGPALLGSDIPIAGVAWTRVSLNISGPPKESALAEFTDPKKVRAVTVFLEQRSSGWKDYPPPGPSYPGLSLTYHLLLTSSHSDIRIDLDLGQSGGRMLWHRGKQSVVHDLSAAEVRQLLRLFGMKWSELRREVVGE